MIDESSFWKISNWCLKCFKALLTFAVAGFENILPHPKEDILSADSLKYKNQTTSSAMVIPSNNKVPWLQRQF